MPISTDTAGTDLPSSTLTVKTRDILAYAAGISDTTSEVFDDRSPELVAPPQICVRLEWPVVSSPASREALGAEADELVRGVHASQDSHFHRVIQPGDELVTEGKIVAVRSTGAGALLCTRLETRNQDGEPVVTSWSHSIYRDVETEGDDREIEAAPALDRGSAEGYERVEIPIAREMPHVYSECADIWNPIHTELTVAEKAGLPDIILHGTATWALAGREIVRRWCDGKPARLRRLYGRFTGMVIPGQPIVVQHGDAGNGKVSFVVWNHEGQPAISDGLAEVEPR